MKLYAPTNLPVDWIDFKRIKNDIREEINLSQNKHLTKWGLRPNVVSNELHDFLDQHNAFVKFAELFYTPPTGKLIWHIDSYEPSNLSKINFVWGSDKHIMQWGKVNHDKEIKPGITTIGSNYIKFAEDEIDIIESVKITRPTLVNAGIPHRVINYALTGRYCLSLVLIKNNNMRLEFQEALSIFKDFIINE